jgi:hypothetical protein
MIGEPKVAVRTAQPYVARRTQATMAELGTLIPHYHAQVYAWLREHGVAPAGAPFIRYRVIDMAATLDIELGVPIAVAMPGDADIIVDSLPAGRYAALT